MTDAHPWRTTFAYLALAAWMLVAAYWFANGPLVTLLRLFGPFDWSFGPVAA